MVGLQPGDDFGHAFLVQLGSEWMGTSNYVSRIFIGKITTLADVLDAGREAGEITVAAIEIGDMSCDPVLEGGRVGLHHRSNAVPIDQVEGPRGDFVTFGEETTGSSAPPSLVNRTPDGGAGLDAVNMNNNVLVGKGGVDVLVGGDGCLEFLLCNAVTSDVELLWV